MSAGIVAAFAFEARCLGALRRHELDNLLTLRAGGFCETLVKVSGMGYERARCAAQDLVKAGAGTLMSWGTAGALDPALDCGTVVLPSKVTAYEVRSGRHAHFHFRTDPLWRERVAGALATDTAVAEGTLLSYAGPVATKEAKSVLFDSTGARAVDMETAAVAEVAAARQLPFMAIRVVVDTAQDSLPEVLVRALAADLRGRPLLSALALPLLCAPAQWGQVARLAARNRLALRSLRRCARAALTELPASLREAGA